VGQIAAALPHPGPELGEQPPNGHAP